MTWRNGSCPTRNAGGRYRYPTPAPSRKPPPPASITVRFFRSTKELSLDPYPLPVRTVGDRHPAVLAEGAGGDLDAGGRLPPLVLAPVHQRHDAPDHALRAPRRHHFRHAAILLHVQLEDRVEDFVFRQGVGIFLARRKFRRRRLREHPFRDHVPAAAFVEPPRHAEHHRLENVLDDREPAGHVPVEGGVPYAHLALVPRGEDDLAELVRQRHQDRATDPRLQVLLRGVRR